MTENKKTGRKRKKGVVKIILPGVLAFLILGLLFAQKAKADFWDDFVDFLDPTQHIGNIIDGEPWKNLPPVPSPQEVIDPLCLFACEDEDENVNTVYVPTPNVPIPMPSVSISANPVSVAYNGSSTLIWNSNNAASCTASGGWTGSAGLSSTFDTGALTETTTFNITCSNSTGSTSGSVTVIVGAQPQPQNPTVSIYANPSNIGYNGSSIISWSSNNATSCFASGGTNGWSGNKNLSGTFNTGNLTNTATFYITCTNNYSSANHSVTVYVNDVQIQIQNPTVTIDADDSSIDYGGSTRIRWHSNNADYCTASGGTNGWSGNQGTSGNFYTGQMTSDRTFRINCYNNSGSGSDSVTVRVDNRDNEDDNDDNRNLDVRVTISADRTNIAYNESTVIRWRARNADSCQATGGANGWSGSRNAKSGSFNTGRLTRTTTYTIYCNNYFFNYRNNRDYDTQSVTVQVGNPTQTDNFLTATTTGATAISNTSAQLNSIIASLKNDSANAWFEWGRTANLGNKTAITSIGASAYSAHSDTIHGLSPRTTYYFRAVAENSDWRNNGVILSFTTSGQTIVSYKAPAKTTAATPTSLVLLNSSIDRNQPIVPYLDNSRPRPGDEINYSLNYQNVGSGSITGATLRIDIPYEVDYMFSNPNNPIRSGNTLIFNLGTVKANAQGAVTIRARVRENISVGANLNFLATLSYVDPSGAVQIVTANVSAQVWNEPANFIDPGLEEEEYLPALAVGADSFLPTNILGWFLLVILLLVLILLSRHLYTKFAYSHPRYIEEPHQH